MLLKQIAQAGKVIGRRKFMTRMSMSSTSQTMPHKNMKAVVFDMGGVLVTPPMVAWKSMEAKYGLPSNSIVNFLMKDSSVHKLFESMERGEISAEAFEVQFSSAYHNSHKSNSTTVLPIFSKLGSIVKHNEAMMDAVQCIKAEGLKTAILTNNYFVADNKLQSAIFMEKLGFFDQVIESCRVGMRKPDKEIYTLTLGKLGVEPHEAVFLDDIGANLKAAKALGLHTIKVSADSDSALNELSNLLQFPVRGYVPGTVVVRPKMRIPMEKLLGYMKDKLNIAPTSQGAVNLNFRQFRHGQSNPTYFLGLGNHNLVLRKKPPGKLLQSAHMVEREYRVMKAIESQNVPVPPLLDLCENSEIIGTPFFLMEYVEGRVLKDPSLSEYGPTQRREIYTAMSNVLAKIHSVNIDQAQLNDFGKKENYLNRQISRWVKQYEASQTREIPAMNKLIDWLPQNIPSNEHCTIVHGDFRLDNLILHPDVERNEVLAVLDWELSTLGDPLTDLATCCLGYYTPSNFPLLKGLSDKVDQLPSMGIPRVEDFVRHYCRKMNRPVLKDEEWAFYVAFIFFRFAAILQGVYKRALQGQASAPNAEAAGMLAEGLATMGWDIVTKSTNTSSIMAQSGNSEKAAATFGWFPSVPQSLPKHSKFVYEKVRAFVEEEVLPAEQRLLKHSESMDCWTPHPVVEDLKKKAKAAELWNLFIPHSLDLKHTYGAGYLSNVEYAHICEYMGHSIFAPEMFNCSAPDTGNMEVLLKYGSDDQKERFLRPLLQGEIRSCFAMTEPAVASSDATNIQSSIVREGDEYVLNGHKWYISGAMHPKCEVCIFMGKTDTSAPRHLQQSMVLVPMNSKGITIKRAMGALGFLDAPFGHAEITFEDVRVPKENLILGEGRGFEIAQGRLGPGRIHHCMRLIGHCERALELMKHRVKERKAFGKTLAEQGTIRADIAKSRMEIEQARLLVLKTAHVIDVKGNKAAAPEIAMIKAVVPNVALKVLDRAIQAHGAMGLSSDTVLASMYVWARALRLADGPDEVHTEAIAKHELKSKL